MLARARVSLQLPWLLLLFTPNRQRGPGSRNSVSPLQISLLPREAKCFWGNQLRPVVIKHIV